MYKDYKDKVGGTVKLRSDPIPYDFLSATEEAVKYGIENGCSYVKVDCSSINTVLGGDIQNYFSKAFTKYVKGRGYVAYGSPKELAFIVSVLG